MEYPIIIEYIKGTENVIADVLSRFDGHAVDQIVSPDLATGIPTYVCPVNDADRLELRTHWLNEQRANPTIARVIHHIDAGTRPDADEIQLNLALQLYIEVWKSLVVENGLLRHVNDNRHSSCIVVPPNLREDVVRSLHQPAHHGFESTLRRVAQRFWWPRVRGDVNTYVRICEVCDRDRNSNPNPRTSLGRLPADQPFATLHIDIVGGQGSLSLGAGPKSIFSMIDGFTGWAEAIPIDDQRAETVARVVFSEWIARYGVPEQIHSDRGVQFESALFEELCAAFGVDKTRTTPYRPQSNGKCERFNRTFITMLRRAVQRRPYDWEPLLPAVLQAYRSTPSEATGFTPFRLAFGREMRLPIDVGTPLPEPPRDIRTFVNSLVEDLEWSYDVAREVSGLQHRRSEARYNERAVEKQYAPGALVRVLQHGRHYGAPSKLVAPYSGLCEVVEVRGPVLTMRELDTQRVFTANHDAVRLSSLRPPPRPQPADVQLVPPPGAPPPPRAPQPPMFHDPLPPISPRRPPACITGSPAG